MDRGLTHIQSVVPHDAELCVWIHYAKDTEGTQQGLDTGASHSSLRVQHKTDLVHALLSPWFEEPTLISLVKWSSLPW